MFEVFSSKIIKDGGVVFASRFDNDLKLKCFKAETIDEMRSLCKSKYLQSDVSCQFENIKECLKQGEKVLFCATPCQVSALKRYLNNCANIENLVLIDFFCHGVPSQSFFDKCIKYVEEKKKIKITNYEFRTKIQKGSTPHYFTYFFNKNKNAQKITKLYLDDPFYLGFQKCLTMRDSCYDCPFSFGNHNADITIGDFHAVNKYIKDINRFDGISTFIINTEKGKRLFDLIKTEINYHELSINRLLEDKVIFSSKNKKPCNRDTFISDLSEYEFKDIVKKYLNSSKEWKKKIYYYMPKNIRNVLKERFIVKE